MKRSPRKPSPSNGNHLMAQLTAGQVAMQAAIATLVQTQADCARDIAASRREMAETQQENRKTVLAIERDFAKIMDILNKHERMLANLPEAIRDKIGFTPKSRQEG